MLSAAVSVASFSVVLAETFAAVGLSTVVPAGVVTLARLVKNLTPVSGEAPAARQGRLEATTKDSVDALKNTPAAAVTALIKAISESLPALDLLLPKTAKIHAEFTFEGSEKYQVAAEGSAGGTVEG